MKPPLQQGSSNDFQTPIYGIEPLLPYLKKSWTIWECAQGNKNIVNFLTKEGYKVIGSDILTGEDFLTWKPEEFDCIVTNPPYSIKQKFLERCYKLGKPFALLLPLTTFETRKRQKLFEDHYNETKFIFLDKRINFETPTGKSSSAWFATMWVCYKLELPKILNYFTVSEQNNLF